MNSPLFRVVIIFLISGALISCSKINLSGNKGGTAPAGGGQGQAGGGGTSLLGAAGQPAGPPSNGQVPTLDGQWEVDYEFKGQQFVCNVEFAQKGSQVVGQGTDQNGLEYTLDGSVAGEKVSLTKKYINTDPPRPPVEYAGVLKYLQTPEYNGWAMEGDYSATTANGQKLSGKWVANPTGPPSGGAEQPPQQAAPTGGIFNAPANNTPPPPPAAPIGQIPSIGNVKPGNISGNYAVAYQYKFKKNNSKLWLKQDGDKLSGDGQDTTSGDKFTIKGWYTYPKITLVRMYRKNAGAKENRDMMFKGVMSSDGNRIVINGETEFGGKWDGSLVRY